MRSLQSKNLNGTSRGLAFRGERRFVRASSSIVTSRTVVRPQRMSPVGQIFKRVKKKKKCVFLNEINIEGERVINGIFGKFFKRRLNFNFT